jgi:cobalamin biosynthesis Mg chelatase CobN
MTVKPSRSPREARTASIVAAACALVALMPAGAQAAGTTTNKLLGVKIPASAQIHTATTPATSVPASATTPSTAPPSATTSPSAPTGAAQPGTVAPPTTTPASAATQTGSTATSALPTTTTPASGSTTVIVAHKQKPSAKGLSAGALALAILGALLVLGCIVWALGRWHALEPRWTISLTHSLREAAYRASETWAEFSDWARLGH